MENNPMNNNPMEKRKGTFIKRIEKKEKPQSYIYKKNKPQS